MATLHVSIRSSQILCQKTNKKLPFGVNLGKLEVFSEAYYKLQGDLFKSPCGSDIYSLAIRKWQSWKTQRNFIQDSTFNLMIIILITTKTQHLLGSRHCSGTFTYKPHNSVWQRLSSRFMVRKPEKLNNLFKVTQLVAKPLQMS